MNQTMIILMPSFKTLYQPTSLLYSPPRQSIQPHFPQFTLFSPLFLHLLQILMIVYQSFILLNKSIELDPSVRILNFPYSGLRTIVVFKDFEDLAGISYEIS